MDRPAGELCPICGERGERRGTKEDAILRECRRDGVLLSWPWETRAAYEAMYTHPTAYHVDECRAIGVNPTMDRDIEHLRAARARMATIRSLYPATTHPTLWDIGAGSGAFVEEAYFAAYQVYGLEPNRALVEAAKASTSARRRLTVGTWQDMRGAADIITLFDVFEHLTDPDLFLRKAHGSLRPGGVLILEMPEWESPPAQAEGIEWKHVKPRQHPVLYSDRAVRVLSGRFGFEVVAFWRPLAGKIGKACWVLEVQP